jgi:Flp pilus assembly protein TadD
MFKHGLLLRVALAPLLVASLASCALDPARAPAEGRGGAAARNAQAAPESHASSAGLFLSGQAAVSAGDFTTAAPLFAEASRLDPDDDYLRGRAFMAELLAGDVDKAGALAALGVPANDENLTGLALLTRSVIALAQSRPADASLILASKAGLGPHGVAADLLKPWAAAMAGDLPGALRLTENPSDKLVAAFGGLSRAEILERAGKPEEAATVYRQLASGRESLFILAEGAFLERAGRLKEARKLYDDALVRAPGDDSLIAARARLDAKGAPPPLQSLRQGAAQALLNPAALLIADRQNDMGLAYLRLTLTLDPERGEAWLLTGEALSNLGDEPGARRAYAQVSPASSSYGSARARLALSYQQAGDIKTALAVATETLKALPKDSGAQVVYAELLRTDNQFDAAIAILSRLIDDKVEPSASANARLYYLRGANEERSGRWREAESDLRQSLKLEPNEAEVLNYLGFAWVDRGEHLKEAMDMLQRAVALSPDSGAIVDSLGWARFRMKDYSGAVKDLEKAVLLEAGDAEINDHLGDAYWRAGRKTEAVFQWKRVLTLHPSQALRQIVETKVREGLADGPSSGLAQSASPAN